MIKYILNLMLAVFYMKKVDKHKDLKRYYRIKQDFKNETIQSQLAKKYYIKANRHLNKMKKIRENGR